MSLVVTEEMCEIHFLDPVPRNTCSICSNKKLPGTKKSYLEPERIIIPSEKRPVSYTPYMWTPNTQCIDTIPYEGDFVHITGSFSASQFNELTERLQQLVWVEVVPSYARLVERNIEWFNSFHIGISARRRFRQN